MTPATVTAEIREAFDIHGDFSSSITFDNIFGLDNLSNTGNVISAQVIAVHRMWKINGIENLPRRGYPNSMDIGKRPIDMLVLRKVNSCYTCQGISPLTNDFSGRKRLSLSLFVLFHLAGHAYNTITLVYFAITAHFLD
jgi:hypothetical protein